MRYWPRLALAATDGSSAKVNVVSPAASGPACNDPTQTFADPTHGKSRITEEREGRIVIRRNLHKAGNYITTVLQLK